MLEELTKRLSKSNLFKRVFYADDWTPKRCPVCFSSPKNFIEYEVDQVANVVCEKSLRCEKCNNTISHWAYGYWQPNGGGSQKMKKIKWQGWGKNIMRSKVVRCIMAVILTIVAVLSIPAFAFMDVNPSSWDMPSRGFSMAIAVVLSFLVVLFFTDK